MCQRIIGSTISIKLELSEKEEIISQKEQKIKELESNNNSLHIEIENKDIQIEDLKDKFERAKERYNEEKAEKEGAKQIAQKELIKQLSPTRDRIKIIGDTINGAWERISKSGKEKITVTELNNILASLQLIIDNLSEAGVWDDGFAKPSTAELVEPPKKATAGKKGTRKKKEPEPVEFEAVNDQVKMEL